MHENIHRTMGQQSGRRSWAEPWKIKMVEPPRMTRREDRQQALAAELYLDSGIRSMERGASTRRRTWTSWPSR